LLRRQDLRPAAVRVDRSVALAGGFVVRCKRCLTPLGVATEAPDPEEDAAARRLRQRCECVQPELQQLAAAGGRPPPAAVVVVATPQPSAAALQNKLAGKNRPGLPQQQQQQQQKPKQQQLTEVRLNKFRLLVADAAAAGADLLAAHDAEAHVGAQVWRHGFFFLCEGASQPFE
jgi:hypothetical protein